MERLQSGLWTSLSSGLAVSDRSMESDDSNKHIRYVVVTPVRDEESHIEKTILSMLAQTILPTEWIIVDDGSNDDTGVIIDRYAQQHSWIKAMHRQNRGFRKSGGGVVETFYEGYGALASLEWDFLSKLDGDLSFAPDYFEQCFKYFSKEPSLGIGGGDVYHKIGDSLILEKNPRFHVRGATKIYRKACWDAVGGLIQAPGWDTLDEVKANMLGWITYSFSDLKLIHHKYTGSADGTWGGWVKNGRANYISGYHPLFMIVKCIKRAFQQPYLISSLGLFYGFITGYLKDKQVSDQALIRYLRNQQMNRLLLKKSIWK
jgi:poly-beta-1,6-N-acetyl-D-glucosamine synthase